MLSPTLSAKFALFFPTYVASFSIPWFSSSSSHLEALNPSLVELSQSHKSQSNSDIDAIIDNLLHSTHSSLSSLTTPESLNCVHNAISALIPTCMDQDSDPFGPIAFALSDSERRQYAISLSICQWHTSFMKVPQPCTPYDPNSPAFQTLQAPNDASACLGTIQSSDQLWTTYNTYYSSIGSICSEQLPEAALKKNVKLHSHTAQLQHDLAQALSKLAADLQSDVIKSRADLEQTVQHVNTFLHTTLTTFLKELIVDQGAQLMTEMAYNAAKIVVDNVSEQTERGLKRIKQESESLAFQTNHQINLLKTVALEAFNSLQNEYELSIQEDHLKLTNQARDLMDILINTEMHGLEAQNLFKEISHSADVLTTRHTMLDQVVERNIIQVEQILGQSVDKLEQAVMNATRELKEATDAAMNSKSSGYWLLAVPIHLARLVTFGLVSEKSISWKTIARMPWRFRKVWTDPWNRALIMLMLRFLFSAVKRLVSYFKAPSPPQPSQTGMLICTRSQSKGIKKKPEDKRVWSKVKTVFIMIVFIFISQCVTEYFGNLPHGSTNQTSQVASNVHQVSPSAQDIAGYQLANQYAESKSESNFELVSLSGFEAHIEENSTLDMSENADDCQTVDVIIRQVVEQYLAGFDGIEALDDCIGTLNNNGIVVQSGLGIVPCDVDSSEWPVAVGSLELLNYDSGCHDTVGARPSSLALHDDSAYQPPKVSTNRKSRDYLNAQLEGSPSSSFQSFLHSFAKPDKPLSLLPDTSNSTWNKRAVTLVLNVFALLFSPFLRSVTKLVNWSFIALLFALEPRMAHNQRNNMFQFNRDSTLNQASPLEFSSSSSSPSLSSSSSSSSPPSSNALSNSILTLIVATSLVALYFRSDLAARLVRLKSAKTKAQIEAKEAHTRKEPDTHLDSESQVDPIQDEEVKEMLDMPWSLPEFPERECYIYYDYKKVADSDEEDCDNKLDKIEAQATREGAYTFDEVDDWLIVEGEEEEDKEDKEDGHGCNNTDFESDDSVDELGIRRGPVPYEQKVSNSNQSKHGLQQ